MSHNRLFLHVKLVNYPWKKMFNLDEDNIFVQLATADKFCFYVWRRRYLFVSDSWHRQIQTTRLVMFLSTKKKAKFCQQKSVSNSDGQYRKQE